MKPILPAILALTLGAGAVQAAPLTVPFDFSRGEIALDVDIGGKPFHMILDTGVDPSVIDIKQAQALGLKIDRAGGGEASGEGGDASAKVFPTTLSGLSIAGSAVPDIEALAFDTSGLSAQFGAQLDGILGYSFLKDRIVLLDYDATALTFFDATAEAKSAIAACKTRYAIPLEGYPDDTIPRVRDFHIGPAVGSISLDTGSNSGVNLYQSALALPGLKEALAQAGDVQFAGARGQGQAKKYVLNAPIAFGPFSLPAGQIVTLRQSPGSDERIANVGNQLFAAMNLKILFDYPGKVVTFLGQCA